MSRGKNNMNPADIHEHDRGKTKLNLHELPITLGSMSFRRIRIPLTTAAVHRVADRSALPTSLLHRLRVLRPLTWPLPSHCHRIWFIIEPIPTSGNDSGVSRLYKESYQTLMLNPSWLAFTLITVILVI